MKRAGRGGGGSWRCSWRVVEGEAGGPAASTQYYAVRALRDLAERSVLTWACKRQNGEKKNWNKHLIYLILMKCVYVFRSGANIIDVRLRLSKLGLLRCGYQCRQAID